MPKKSSKDGSDTRKRRGSTKDTRGAVSSTEEVLMPPTPKENHLFASNPFDDPPPNSFVGTGPGYMQGSTRLINPSMQMSGMPPNYMPKGPFSPSGWRPGPGMHGPITPGWQQAHTDPMPPMTPQGYPYAGPPTDFNRFPMTNQPPPQMKHSPFGPPMPGQDIPREGPPFEHIMQDQSHIPVPATMAHAGNAIYPKVLPRRQEKTRKSDMGMFGNKMKKLKPPDTQPAPKPVTEARIDDWNANAEKSSPKLTKGVAPHAAFPILPQTCLECSKELEEPLDETICCLASCKGWYHRACTGLTKTAHDCLRGEELALWACDRCLSTREITAVKLRKANQTHSSEVPAPPIVAVKS